MENWRPDISIAAVALSLQPRTAPYFQILQFCRHIGLHVRENRVGYWVARVRRQDRGYSQQRLCKAFADDQMLVEYSDACKLAEDWFNGSNVRNISAEPYPVGSLRQLKICPFGEEHSVGHALKDYLDWKLLAATRSHFETMVSMINYHIVPRLAHLTVAEFNGQHFHQFALDVMQTPPKTGRMDPRGKRDIHDLSQDELRKRKKTLNSLVSILRGAFELAWEHGHIENDRSLRCLRRLPNVDRPRVVFLNRTDCQKLLKACDPDIKQLVLAALYTGCRAKELMFMTVSDFSAVSRSLFVASPKGQRTRHVLLPTEGVEFFQSIAKRKSPTDRLFRKRNGRIWSGEYKSYFLRARTKAGFSKEVTFHGLRHTYASHLLENGASLLTVANQLGHADVKTVSTTYGHLTNKFREAEIERCFSPLFARTSGPEEIITDLEAKNVIPMFRHRYSTSWPLSNHSKYSGPILKDIRPSSIDCGER